MKKTLIVFIIIVLVALGVYAVYNNLNKNEQGEKAIIKVAVLKGPTGIGMAKLMKDNTDGNTKNKYEFTAVGSPEEIVAKVSSGEADIAAISGNLAATLYNKTDGYIYVGAINTLGVLYILDNTNQISSIEDLKGKEIYATGQGAVPEFALKYILEANGLVVGEDVTITFLKEHSELVALASSGQADICMLPEPFVSTLISKDDSFKISLNLTEEWQKAADIKNEEASLIMGVIIARKDFVDNNKETWDKFLEEYEESTKYTNSHVEETARLVVQYDIISNEEIVRNAIPNCNITFVKNEEMKNRLFKFYEVLYNLEPKSVGGKIPSEEFYYSN